MNWKLMPLAALLAVAALTACKKNDDNNNDINSTDRSYVTSAALSNTAEISAANLAITKSVDPSIRSYAQMMITGHTKSQDSLQMIAGQLGLYAPDSLDAAHVQMAAMLQTLSGTAFDSAYIHGQVTDHQATLSLFQTEASQGNNGSVKSYEAQYIDDIEMHLAMADTLAAKY